MDAIKRRAGCQAGRRVQGVVLSLSALFLTLAVNLANAQQTGPTTLQSYPLRYARADSIRPVLVGMLPGGSEVLADYPSNRLLVRGSAQSQQIAAEVVRSLDQARLAQLPPPVQRIPPPQPTQPAHPTPPAPPAPPTPPVVAVDEVVVRAYRVTPSQAPGLKSYLRGVYGQVPGFRMAVDERTSRILVTAPSAVHAQIAGWLSPVAASGNPPVAPPPAPATATASAPGAAGAGTARQIQIRNTTSAELESKLAAVLGDRLLAIGGESTHSAAYRLLLAGGASLDMWFDRPTGRVILTGPTRAVDSCSRMIVALDGPGERGSPGMGVVSLRTARMADVRKAIGAVNSGVQQPPAAAVERQMQLARNLQQLPPAAAGQPTPGPGAGAAVQAAAANAEGALRGPVQVEILEGLDVLVLRGDPRDVAQVEQLIRQIEQLSVETEPVIEVHPLRYVDCSALEEMISALYEEVFSVRRGTISITALVKPNALLLIGRKESVATVLDLVEQLDRPVEPHTQFQVFRLKHAAAETAQETIEEFYDEREGLGTKVLAIADFRSNSLVVQASPRDLAEVAAMIEELDVGDSPAINEIRLFKLQNSLAADIQPVLEEAIIGDGGGQQGGEERSTTLRFVTVGADGQQILKSGILSDVRITADENGNGLLVSAPAASMPLIEALIRELDQLPVAEAQIKVFTINEGDATTMVEMLETLFGQSTGTQQVAQTPVRTGAVEGESSLVQLRFAVDSRTNSIIASGSVGDLSVVEAILLRLDESDVRDRKTTVVRLNNAPAEDVANAVNDYLSSQRQVQQIEEGLSVFEQLEREVIVVPEVVSNSLIISATPRYFDEIAELVDQLDQPPPMVMIQVLIAEVQLSDTDEFGVELGVQDSILFDRSLLGNIVTTAESFSDPSTGIVTTTENITSATIDPGFLFNNSQPLGNSGASSALRNADVVGSQALSNFAVGRLNSELGFGGLVLSASSEAVNILIRALQEKRRVDILSRPQVMTLDNQQAFVMVGQRVPRISGTTTNETGQTNQIVTENVGLILGVTPRISPEGTVVMEIDVDKSELGPEAEGIPVSISEGQVIRSPRINTTTAQTTVSARDGQTILLGGLITKNKSTITRRVPGLADIPFLGSLFRYDNLTTTRSELLIILTPHIVDNVEDSEWLLQSEAERMSWCLRDLAEFPETAGLKGRGGDWSDVETTTIYPESGPQTDPLVPPETAPAVPEAPSLDLPGPNAPTMAPPLEEKSSRWRGPAITVEPAAYRAAQTAEPEAARRALPAYDSYPPPSPPGSAGGVIPAYQTYQTPPPPGPGQNAVPAYDTYRTPAPGPTGGVIPAYEAYRTPWPSPNDPQVRVIAPSQTEIAAGLPPEAAFDPQATVANRPSSASPFLEKFYRDGSRRPGMADGYRDATGRRLF